jgi:hypothetical protein
MKVVSIEQLSAVLADLPDNPRVIASGNVATPTVLLDVLDRQIPSYRLHMLNAQRGIPDRDGVTYETTFIGPGMRGSERLQYVPCRLSLVPILYRDHYRPDVVLLHTSARHHDTVSLGLETNVLPAAIDAAREHGGLVAHAQAEDVRRRIVFAVDGLIGREHVVLAVEPASEVGACAVRDSEHRVLACVVAPSPGRGIRRCC